MIQIGVGDTFLMQEGVLSRNAEFGMGKFIELHRKTATFVPNLIEHYWTGNFPICKINFYVTNPGTREEIVTALQAKHLPVVYETGVAGNIEMVSDKSGKGAGLLELARYLNVPREQVIAVGDNYNDETMLKAAGLAVAMGNAVPAIKALAHEITADNAHDGVAEVIERYLLNK
jgi:hydroxymethylpyrimidine pyrophosphatase-like HAD family hydrolase